MPVRIHPDSTTPEPTKDSVPDVTDKAKAKVKKQPSKNVKAQFLDLPEAPKDGRRLYADMRSFTPGLLISSMNGLTTKSLSTITLERLLQPYNYYLHADNAILWSVKSRYYPVPLMLPWKTHDGKTVRFSPTHKQFDPSNSVALSILDDNNAAFDYFMALLSGFFGREARFNTVNYESSPYNHLISKAEANDTGEKSDVCVKRLTDYFKKLPLYYLRPYQLSHDSCAHEAMPEYKKHLLKNFGFTSLKLEKPLELLAWTKKRLTTSVYELSYEEVYKYLTSDHKYKNTKDEDALFFRDTVAKPKDQNATVGLSPTETYPALSKAVFYDLKRFFAFANEHFEKEFSSFASKKTKLAKRNFLEHTLLSLSTRIDVLVQAPSKVTDDILSKMSYKELLDTASVMLMYNQKDSYTQQSMDQIAAREDNLGEDRKNHFMYLARVLGYKNEKFALYKAQLNDFKAAELTYYDANRYHFPVMSGCPELYEHNRLVSFSLEPFITWTTDKEGFLTEAPRLSLPQNVTEHNFHETLRDKLKFCHAHPVLYTLRRPTLSDQPDVVQYTHKLSTLNNTSTFGFSKPHKDTTQITLPSLHQESGFSTGGAWLRGSLAFLAEALGVPRADAEDSEPMTQAKEDPDVFKKIFENIGIPYDEFVLGFDVNACFLQREDKQRLTKLNFLDRFSVWWYLLTGQTFSGQTKRFPEGKVREFCLSMQALQDQAINYAYKSYASRKEFLPIHLMYSDNVFDITGLRSFSIDHRLRRRLYGLMVNGFTRLFKTFHNQVGLNSTGSREDIVLNRKVRARTFTLPFEGQMPPGNYDANIDLLDDINYEEGEPAESFERKAWNLHKCENDDHLNLIVRSLCSNFFSFTAFKRIWKALSVDVDIPAYTVEALNETVAKTKTSSLFPWVSARQQVSFNPYDGIDKYADENLRGILKNPNGTQTQKINTLGDILCVLSGSDKSLSDTVYTLSYNLDDIMEKMPQSAYVFKLHALDRIHTTKDNLYGNASGRPTGKEIEKAELIGSIFDGINRVANNGQDIENYPISHDVNHKFANTYLADHDTTPQNAKTRIYLRRSMKGDVYPRDETTNRSSYGFTGLVIGFDLLSKFQDKEQQEAITVSLGDLIGSGSKSESAKGESAMLLNTAVFSDVKLDLGTVTEKKYRSVVDNGILFGIPHTLAHSAGYGDVTGKYLRGANVYPKTNDRQNKRHLLRNGVLDGILDMDPWTPEEADDFDSLTPLRKLIWFCLGTDILSKYNKIFSNRSYYIGNHIDHDESVMIPLCDEYGKTNIRFDFRVRLLGSPFPEFDAPLVTGDFLIVRKVPNRYGRKDNDGALKTETVFARVHFEGSRVTEFTLVTLAKKAVKVSDGTRKTMTWIEDIITSGNNETPSEENTVKRYLPFRTNALDLSQRIVAQTRGDEEFYKSQLNKSASEMDFDKFPDADL